MLEPNVSQDYRPDRRAHSRYRVAGSVVFDADGSRYSGRPVDLSLGGLLFNADREPPLDSEGVLQLRVNGFGEIILADVRVIRTRGSTAAAIFILPRPSLARCVAWLAHNDRQEREQ